jgi:hypothetical protein
MPAPSLTILLDFETQLESIFRALLKPVCNAYPPLQVVTYHSEEDLQYPYLELMISVDGELDQVSPPMLNYSPPSSYGYTVDITHHYKGRQSKVIRGAIRAALTTITVRDYMDVHSSGYLDINEITHASSSRTIDTAERSNSWTVSYTGSFSIKTNAWPQ